MRGARKTGRVPVFTTLLAAGRGRRPHETHIARSARLVSCFDSSFASALVGCRFAMQCSTREVATYVPPHSSIGERIAARDGQKKGAVIRWLTGFAAPLLLRFLIRDRASPSFNRMSGITEFTNAVCLFVNVDSSNYSNTFYQKGRGMSHLRAPCSLVENFA